MDSLSNVGNPKNTFDPSMDRTNCEISETTIKSGFSHPWNLKVAQKKKEQRDNLLLLAPLDMKI